MQQILVMETENNSPRSPCVGWSFYDGSNVNPNMDVPIGVSDINKELAFHRHCKETKYDCVLRAMANGWKVLSAPSFISNRTFIWHLSREAEQVLG